VQRRVEAGDQSVGIFDPDVEADQPVDVEARDQVSRRDDARSRSA
jgi:hypothetical protein